MIELDFNDVYTNVVMMDKYLPGIVALVNNNVSPEEAILKVEN